VWHRARGGPHPYAAFAAAVAALATASAVSAQAPLVRPITSADSVQITAVEFGGVRVFDADVLATAIVTAPTRCTALRPLCWIGIGVVTGYLDTRTLAQDVARLRVFYYQRGYRDARVTFDTDSVEDGVRVRFDIEEREPVLVDSIGFDGAQGLPSRVTRDLPLAAGAPLSLIAYEAARDTMITRLHNRGYALADVLANYTIPHDSAYGARVRFELVPGRQARFGVIEVAGAEKVTPAVVRRMLTFKPGDRYSRQALLESQRNLFGQELFRHAEIHAVPAPGADTLIDVRVQVNEGELRRVRLGAGISTSEYANVEGRWISRSFLGGARRLELRAQVTNLLARPLAELPFFEASRDIYGRIAGNGGADFSQPWFFSPLNTLGAGVFAERRSIPDVFVRTAYGAYLSLARNLGVGTSLNLAHRLERTRLESAEGDLIFCLGFTACGPAEIQILQEPHWLAPAAVSFVRDASNSIFAPSSGYIIRLDAEAASDATGSDFDYARFVADFTDYHALGRGVVLAYRLRAGWAEPIGGADNTLGVHPQKRFFAGGPNSVRGFAQYRLGPRLLTVDAAGWLARPVEEEGAGCTASEINGGTCEASGLAERMPELFNVQPIGGGVMTEGNLEMRFPVFGEKLRGAAFLDAGQVWRDRADFDARDLTWTPGFGVRYFSPIGPIRIDVGYNPTGVERLSVVTTEVQHCPPDGPCEPIRDDTSYDYRELRNLKTLRPLDPVAWDPRRSFFDRLQFHFSIGQAF